MFQPRALDNCCSLSTAAVSTSAANSRRLVGAEAGRDVPSQADKRAKMRSDPRITPTCPETFR
jgi:hypothetical protein